MEGRWTNEHGPDELYDKFKVVRSRTGEELTGTGEFLFVLRPETDPAAVDALYTYADVAERLHGSTKLAEQIRQRLHQIEVANGNA